MEYLSGFVFDVLLLSRYIVKTFFYNSWFLLLSVEMSHIWQDNFLFLLTVFIGSKKNKIVSFEIIISYFIQ
jgi:hypothetical protein